MSEQHNDLNPEQERAVRHIDGPVRIMAGAGTGKTMTLTRRFVHLVDTGVPPHEILAVTYTSKAAGELRSRVLTDLPRSYRDLWITTFHGFCRRLLEGWHSADVTDPPRMISDDEMRLHVNRAAETTSNSALLRYRGPRGQRALAADLATIITKAKDELISVDDLAAFALETSNERLIDLAAGFANYEQLRAEGRWRDFGDLTQEVVDRLRADPALLAATRERFRHVLVDEFQDVNKAQFELLRVLVPPGGNLCVVGDPNQAIYAFRGGKSRYMRDFETYFPAATTIELTQNFRSGQLILDRANRLIEHDASAEPFQLIASDRARAGFVSVHMLRHEDYEAEWITRQIRSLLRQDDSDFAFSDFAILLRSVVHSAEPLRRALAMNGIPYRVGSVAGVEYGIVQDVLAVLRIALEEGGWVDVTRLAAQRGVEPALLRAIETAVPDAIARDALLDPNQPLPPSLPVAGGNAIFSLREMVFELKQLRQLPVPQLFYQALLFAGHLHSQVGANKAGFLSELTKMAESLGESGASHQEFLQQVTQAWDIRIEQPPDVAQGVQILTVHAAKGLEWKVVFVAGLADGRFPTLYRYDQELDVESVAAWRAGRPVTSFRTEEERSREFHDEERRLAYVAMTRARDYLYLSAPLALKGREVSISPFISEAFSDEEIEEVRRAGDEGQAVSVSDMAARLHIRRGRALNSDIAGKNAAQALADLLLAEWACGKIDGVWPLRDLRAPEPNNDSTVLRFSYSSLEQYQACPRRYLYSRILRIDAGRESDSMTVGNLVHKALEKLNNRWFADSTPPGSDEIDAVVAEVWNNSEFSFRQLGEQQLLRAGAMLRRYYAYERERSDRRRPIAVEDTVYAKVGRHDLHGKTDLVLEGADGGVEIIDFKTGSGSGLKKAMESLQLYIYNLAWLAKHPERVPVVSYYKLKHELDRGFRNGDTWDSKKQELSHRFEGESADAMWETTNALLDGILANSFVSTPSADTCRYCDYRRICPDVQR